MAPLILSSPCRAELIDNEWLALDLPQGWEITKNADNPESGGYELELLNKKGECMINIDIIPYSGDAKGLAKKIREEMRAKKIVISELDEKNNVYFCHLKQGNTPGMLYISGNGREASMATIYGSRRMIKRAQDILKNMSSKKELPLFAR